MKKTILTFVASITLAMATNAQTTLTTYDVMAYSQWKSDMQFFVYYGLRLNIDPPRYCQDFISNHKLFKKFKDGNIPQKTKETSKLLNALFIDIDQHFGK